MIDAHGWNHDMSQAPRDGTQVDLWVIWSDGTSERAAGADCEDGQWWCCNEDGSYPIQPERIAAWRPLPEPPVMP